MAIQFNKGEFDVCYNGGGTQVEAIIIDVSVIKDKLSKEKERCIEKIEELKSYLSTLNHTIDYRHNPDNPIKCSKKEEHCCNNNGCNCSSGASCCKSVTVGGSIG